MDKTILCVLHEQIFTVSVNVDLVLVFVSLLCHHFVLGWVSGCPFSLLMFELLIWVSLSLFPCVRPTLTVPPDQVCSPETWSDFTLCFCWGSTLQDCNQPLGWFLNTFGLWTKLDQNGPKSECVKVECEIGLIWRLIRDGLSCGSGSQINWFHVHCVKVSQWKKGTCLCS